MSSTDDLETCNAVVVVDVRVLPALVRALLPTDDAVNERGGKGDDDTPTPVVAALTPLLVT